MIVDKLPVENGCPVCGGTGICQTCKGTGRCQTCDGTARLEDGRLCPDCYEGDCYPCDGTGKCPTCQDLEHGEPAAF